MMRRMLGVCTLIQIMLVSVTCFAAAEDVMGKTRLYNDFGEEMELAFELYDPGSEDVVDYEKYGVFVGIGTADYKYEIKDRKALSAAVGEGVYPSNSVYKDPAYTKIVQSGKLKGSHWDFVHVDNHQLSFYKWATTGETPGVKQFYAGLALEKAGHLKQALKAYHAVVVHFARDIGWTYWHTPIYYSKIAADRIHFILNRHPELGLKFVGFDVQITNGFNLDINDDVWTAFNPGKFIRVKPEEVRSKPVDVSKLKVVKSVGSEHTRLVQFENGHWQFQVDGKPFMIRAVAYEPTPVGQSAHSNTRQDWMQADLNGNGAIDGPYDSWVDANGNSLQDANEPAVGDFELLRAMGANALRHYHGASNKALLTEAYTKYGMMAVIGDLLGMYGVGSGADWYEGTDFTNPEHLKTMEASIRKTVLEHKDEPYLLMWMLSNEGNYGFVGNKDKKIMGFGSKGKEQHRAMYEFANRMAIMIKELDPNHPVGFSNGEVIFVDAFGEIAKDIDVFGCNAYRGSDGFGESFWRDIKHNAGKPVFLTEFGCPSFHNSKPIEEAEELQAEYHRGNWSDIMANRAGWGYGNAIGGTVYQFVDEWWKAGPSPEFDPTIQETVGDFTANFPDGWMHEEWLGITSQGDGSQSPYLRRLRPAYEYYRQAWNTKSDKH